MLIEKSHVSQNPREGIRRWFADEEMELIVWQPSAGSEPDAFHLCYKVGPAEYMLTWNAETGYDHGRIQGSDQSPTRNRAPSLRKDRKLDRRKLLADFVARSPGVESVIAECVAAKILEFGETALDSMKHRPAEPAPSFPSPKRGGAGVGASGAGGGAGTPVPKPAPVPAPRAPLASGPAPLSRVEASPRTDGRLAEDLVRKVRMIEITTRRMVDDVMSGQYRTHFKGHGVQFSEHRLYVPGDDVRHIDWKVSARSRDPLIKKYEEERELTVLLVVDASGSEAFGSSRKLKSETAAEIAGMLAYAAVHTGDKAGMLIFAGKVEKIIPPKKGRQHVLRIVRDVLSHRAATRGTDLKGALDSAGRIMKHSGVIFVISDFLAEGYEIPLKRLARRHDVVAVQVGDERERQVPDIGHVLLMDPESGEERLVDTGSYAFKKWLEEQKTAHETDTETALKGGRVECLRVLTKDDYGDAVVRFFRKRAKRR
jgi:uncharacterized protein (DUF58 family)